MNGFLGMKSSSILSPKIRGMIDSGLSPKKANSVFKSKIDYVGMLSTAGTSINYNCIMGNDHPNRMLIIYLYAWYNAVQPNLPVATIDGKLANTELVYGLDGTQTGYGVIIYGKCPIGATIPVQVVMPASSSYNIEIAYYRAEVLNEEPTAFSTSTGTGNSRENIMLGKANIGIAVTAGSLSGDYSSGINFDFNVELIDNIGRFGASGIVPNPLKPVTIINSGNNAYKWAMTMLGWI